MAVVCLWHISGTQSCKDCISQILCTNVWTFFNYWWWFGFCSLLILFPKWNFMTMLVFGTSCFCMEKVLMLIVSLLWQKISFFSFISPSIIRLVQRAVFLGSIPIVTMICSKALLGYRTLKELVPLLLLVESKKFTQWEMSKLGLEIHITMTGIFKLTAVIIRSTTGICDRPNNPDQYLL